MEERTITLTGERTASTDNPLELELGRHIDRRSPGQLDLKLDLQNVAYITSVEIGTLVSLHKAALACGGKLTLVNVGDNVQEVLAVCKLNQFLNMA